MIAIIDYGMGNLFSLSSSLKSLGYEVEITADPETGAAPGPPQSSASAPKKCISAAR